MAYGLAAGGGRVTILERGSRCGDQASAAAAGMLAQGAEATEGGPFLALCRLSWGLWPEFASGLARASGVDCELEQSGLLRLATDTAGVERLRLQAEAQRHDGVQVSRVLSPEELRRLLPGLGHKVLAGLHYPQDGHVHSHRVVDALVGACRGLGVAVETDTEVESCSLVRGRPRLTVKGGEARACDFLIVAAGSWSGSLIPGKPGDGSLVEPIRGQIVAVDPGRRLLSQIVYGDHGYLLQKRSGLVLLGSTEERAGFDSWATLAGVADILPAVLDLVPELGQARVAHVWAGLRPRFRDGLPLLGRLEPGCPILMATGHFRNGVLLAPATSQLLVRAVLEGEDPPELRPFSPVGRLGAAAPAHPRPKSRP